MVWERKILIKICGPTYGKAYWKMRLKEDTYNIFKPPGIVTVIEVCKLEWLGHVVRKDGERAVNRDGRRNSLIKVNGLCRSGREEYGFKNGEKEVWVKENGQLWVRKGRPKLKVCSVKEEKEEEEEEEEEGEEEEEEEEEEEGGGGEGGGGEGGGGGGGGGEEEEEEEEDDDDDDALQPRKI
jgi:uncharacterized membrane protein YgcG